MKRFLVFVLSILGALSAAAQERVVPATYTYAAKFVCGQVTAPVFVATGTYLSTTNVHNPSRWEVAELRKKFAVALPGERVGPISPYFPMRLRADEAMQIDCRNIAEHLKMSPAQFVEGFIVIESSIELDVVTVYTGGSGANAQITTMHTERAPVRVDRSCVNREHSLNTGAASWQVVQENNNNVTPRAAVNITHDWIGAGRPPMISGYAGGSGPAGTTTYESCFCLCTGGATLRLTDLIADNYVEVFLNGTAIGPAIDSSQTATWATPAQLTAINNAAAPRFVAGRNCLRLRVRNDSGVTGVALRGLVAGAFCPLQ